MLKINSSSPDKKDGLQKMSSNDSFQRILGELNEIDPEPRNKKDLSTVLVDLMVVTSLSIERKREFKNRLRFTNNTSGSSAIAQLVDLNNRALRLVNAMQIGDGPSNPGVGAGGGNTQDRRRLDLAVPARPGGAGILQRRPVGGPGVVVSGPMCENDIHLNPAFQEFKNWPWVREALITTVLPMLELLGAASAGAASAGAASAGAGGAGVSRVSTEGREAYEAAMKAKSKIVQVTKTFMEERLGPLSPFAPSSANLKHATLGQHATLSFCGAFSLGFLIFGLCSDTWGLTIQDHDKILQTLCQLPAETKWVITNFLVGKNGELTESMLKAFGTQCSAESGVFSTRMQEIMNLRLPTGTVGYKEFHGVIGRILGYKDFTDRNYIFQPEILSADYINESALQVARVSGQRKEILEMIGWAGGSGTNPQSMMSTINNPTALNAFDAARRNDFSLLDGLIRSMVTSLEGIAVDRSNFRFNSVFVLTLICIALGIVGYASYPYYKRRKLKWENLTEAQRAEFGRRRTPRKSRKSIKRNSFGRRRKNSTVATRKASKKNSFGRKRKVSRKKKNSRK